MANYVSGRARILNSGQSPNWDPRIVAGGAADVLALIENSQQKMPTCNLYSIKYFIDFT